MPGASRRRCLDDELTVETLVTDRHILHAEPLAGSTHNPLEINREPEAVAIKELRTRASAIQASAVHEVRALPKVEDDRPIAMLQPHQRQLPYADTLEACTRFGREVLPDVITLGGEQLGPHG